MLTTAIFGLLNRNQIFFASKMTQLAVYDDKSALLNVDSDISYSENDEDLVSKKQTSKSIYAGRIAKNLINSKDKVDKRMLKLHKILENSH